VREVDGKRNHVALGIDETDERSSDDGFCSCICVRWGVLRRAYSVGGKYRRRVAIGVWGLDGAGTCLSDNGRLYL
jgi:hypothetical protein